MCGCNRNWFSIFRKKKKKKNTVSPYTHVPHTCAQYCITLRTNLTTSKSEIEIFTESVWRILSSACMLNTHSQTIHMPTHPHILGSYTTQHTVATSINMCAHIHVLHAMRNIALLISTFASCAQKLAFTQHVCTHQNFRPKYRRNHTHTRCESVRVFQIVYDPCVYTNNAFGAISMRALQ